PTLGFPGNRRARVWTFRTDPHNPAQTRTTAPPADGVRPNDADHHACAFLRAGAQHYRSSDREPANVKSLSAFNPAKLGQPDLVAGRWFPPFPPATSSVN